MLESESSALPFGDNPIFRQQEDSSTAEDKMQMATDAVLNRQIDLSSMTPTLKSSALHVLENGKMILQTNSGSGLMNHELTPSEQTALSNILNSDLNEADKKQRIGNLVGGIAINQQASVNYEKIALENQQRDLTRAR